MKNIMKWIKSGTPSDALTFLTMLIAVCSSLFLSQSPLSEEQKHKKKHSVTIRQQTMFVVDQRTMHGEGDGNIKAIRLKLPPTIKLSSKGKETDKIAYDRIYIENAGSNVIRKNDFIEPIRVTAPLNTSILSVNISDKSKRWQPNIQGSVITFPKCDFNTKEKIQMDIVYEFNDKEWKKKWNWEGNIAYIKELEYIAGQLPQSLDGISDHNFSIFYREALVKDSSNKLHILLMNWEIAIFCLYFLVSLNFALITSKWKKWMNFSHYALGKLLLLCFSSMAVAEILTYSTFGFKNIGWALWIWSICGIIYIGLILLFRFKPSKVE